MAPQRDPDRTRRELLTAAYREIHLNGYQAASLDTILKQTDLTKGALYHHFPNKKALGLAVVDEVIAPWVRETWVTPLHADDDPIRALEKAMGSAMNDLAPEYVRMGCPLLNISQEMSPVDEDFRRRINGVFETWRGSLTEALRRGQERGIVRDDVDPPSVAAFIVSSLEGIAGTVKASQSPELARSTGRVLRQFLDSLRPLPDDVDAGRARTDSGGVAA